jgi:hypothetical protein
MVTLTAPERSFKSISGMVELVHGIVPMGSAQTAEFEWVSPRGVVTPVDMQLIEDQLERFADSPGHILHAKIIGATRDGAVALASKKSPADIVCHAGNLRKSAAVAQAAIHASSKSTAIAKPIVGKLHPAAEPPAGVKNLLLLNLLLLSEWWPYSTTTLQNLMMAQMFSLKHMMLMSMLIARRGYK